MEEREQPPMTGPQAELPPIAGVPTAIAAFAGWAPCGPTDRATSVTGWDDYDRLFGGLHADSALGYGVAQFFANGGQRAIVVRIGGDTPLAPNNDAFRAALATDGIARLADVDLFTLLVVPGLTDPARLGELALFCRERRALLIADTPNTTDLNALAAVPGDGRLNAAIYYPWVRLPDPLQGGAARAFPPSGAVAGVYARIDAAHGVWTSPAGKATAIQGAAGTARALSEAEFHFVNGRAVNTLGTFPGWGTVVWGSRTSAGDEPDPEEWKYVKVRRTALFIEESLRRGLAWAASEPNGEPLWTVIRGRAGAFLHDLFVRGAFEATTPRDAFFVKCDATTTTPADIDAGVVTLLVGFAPGRPGEFVVLTIRLRAGAAA
jgi:phage tail sheath protein FI